MKPRNFYEDCGVLVMCDHAIIIKSELQQSMLEIILALITVIKCHQRDRLAALAPDIVQSKRVLLSASVRPATKTECTGQDFTIRRL